MAEIVEARENITDTLLRTNEVDEGGVYNITDRIISRLDAAGWEINRRLTREMVVEALQDAWNDYVTDCGEYPDAFTINADHHGRSYKHTLTARFERGNFVTSVTDILDLKLQGKR